MRDIKFRAWDNVHSSLGCRMVYHGDGMNLGHLTDFWQWIRQHNPMPVMQFTGLFDKNGKDIYEGDILFDGNDSYDQVVYQENKFILEPLGDDCVYWEKTEVVGNIYEHSHLLK